MSHTNETPNFDLPQFTADDKPDWLVDVNAAFLAIDTGMEATQSEAESATSTAQLAQETAAGAAETAGQAASDVAGLTTNLETLQGTVNTVTALIGNGTPTTTDKTIIGAINEINGKVSTSYEVEADGVKTYGQALNSLFSHIAEVKPTSKVAITVGGAVRVMSIYQYSGVVARFSGLSFDGSNNVAGLMCDMQASSGVYSSSTGTVTTITDTVIPSGTSVILYI